MLGFFTHKAFVLNSPDHHPTLSWTAVTADTAPRLRTYFGVSPETWLGLQLEYDLRRTRADVVQGFN